MAIGVFPAADAWFKSGVSSYYPYSTVAGLTTNQKRGYEGERAAAQTSADLARDYQSLYRDYIQEPQWDPYLSEVVDAYADSMNRTFSRNTIPSLRGQAVSSGSFGGSRAALAEGLAASDLNTQIGEQTSNLLSQGWTDVQDRYLDALQGATDVYTYADEAARVPSQLQGQWGTLQQTINQNRIDDSVDRWDYYRDQPLARLQAYADLIGGQTSANIASSVTSSGSSTSSGSGAATTGSNISQIGDVLSTAGGLMGGGTSGTSGSSGTSGLFS